LAIDTTASSPRPAVLRKTSLPLELVAGPSTPLQKLAPPAPSTPAAEPTDPYTSLMIDPRTVPLPPSPPSPALVVDEDATDFSLSPASFDKVVAPGPSTLTCSPSLKEVKQIGRLRLEDNVPRNTRAEAIEEGPEEEEEEEDDVIQPLRSMTSQSNRKIVESPVTASTVFDELRTPTSPSFSDNVVIRQDSRSPPRSAGGGSGRSPNKNDVPVARPPPQVGLGRKESKWRRSVMNLSDVSRCSCYARATY
jgi:hypothetical protein